MSALRAYRTQLGHRARSEKCHVWTAPSWQELSSRMQRWSVQPCVRPVGAVHMTAGHNALRGSGPASKARIRQCDGTRLYVPSTNEATHPRCCDEGYPDGPGRASNLKGESWAIIPKPLSESIRQNRVMQSQLPMAAVAARCGISGSSLPRRQRSESSWPSLQRNTVI